MENKIPVPIYGIDKGKAGKEEYVMRSAFMYRCKELNAKGVKYKTYERKEQL